MTILDDKVLAEIRDMIRLASAQIEVGAIQGECSAAALVATFSQLATGIQAINDLAQNQASQSEQVLKQSEALSLDVQNAVVALQFYDRLMQRLSHVSTSLTSLADLVDEGEGLNSPEKWAGFKQQLTSTYTLNDEQIVFDKVMQGVPVATILIQQKTPANDDAEFF